MVDETKSFSDVMNEKLTPTEIFLINGKNEFETWERSYTKKSNREFYRDLGNLISISSKDVIDDLNRSKTTVSITNLQRMLSYYEDNGVMDEITLFISKKEGPLLIYNGEIWVALAPLTEGDD